jgi:predicted GNAT family N-acyltransferase
MDASFQLTHCSWQDNGEALGNVRRIVFIEEQHVPEALELDEFDPVCHHVLITAADNQPIAAGRISPDGRIGRMAVLKEYRGQGIGSALLTALLEYARQEHYAGIYLHAQITAIPFYEKHGFLVTGEQFMDAGIPHRNMVQKPANRTH